MKNESMRYGYALVRIIRLAAYLLLIASMLFCAFQVCTLVAIPTTNEAKKVDIINQKEQAAYKSNQLHYERSCAEAKQKAEDVLQQREALISPLNEALRVLTQHGRIMDVEMERFGSRKSFTPYESSLRARELRDIPNIENTLVRVKILINQNKELMTKEVEMGFTTLMIPHQAAIMDLQKKEAALRAELAALMEKYKPITKEVCEYEKKQVESKQIDTLYGPLHTSNVQSRVQNIRLNLPKYTDVRRFTDETNIKTAVTLNDYKDKIIKWLPTTPAPEFTQVQHITYVKEDPIWSPEDALRRDMIRAEIPRVQKEQEKETQAINELAGRQKETQAMIAEGWLIEQALEKACQSVAKILEIRDYDVDAAINQARQDKEAADQNAAAVARMTRNSARSFCIGAQLLPLMDPVFGPLAVLVGGVVAWFLTMILADFLATPLVIALRTQSIDEQFKQTNS
ncbi:MAG: hypothetical protein ACI4OX_03485 [Akkermansia sp.]